MNTTVELCMVLPIFIVYLIFSICSDDNNNGISVNTTFTPIFYKNPQSSLLTLMC